MTGLVDLILNSETDAGRPITRQEIIKCLLMAEYYLNTRSLNTLVGEDEETELIEFLPDNEAPSIDEIISDRERAETLDRILKTLKPREEKIIRARFGLGTGEPLTLEAIGKMHNLTRERIRQIEVKAIRKLKHASRSEHLKGFLEG